jgi:hypothetical protein
MRRVLLLAVVLALQTACSTLATMEGAKPLAKGQAQVGMGLSLQVGGNPISYAGVPLPQLELAGRVGVAEDVDVGLRLYLLGAAFDTRYRFWHRDRLHLAVAPGLSGFWIPAVGGTASGQGSAELRVPVTAEVDVAKWLSVSGAPRLLLRDQWNSVSFAGVGSGASSRLDVYTGFGARGELHVRRFVMGLSGDVFLQPARSGGLAWSVGLDFGLRGKKP